MSFEQLLASVPVDHWQTRQAIAFDWYDGPREGICSLANPAVEFFYSLLGERQNSDDADDRLFRLSEIPEGSVASAIKSLADLGLASDLSNPVWCPIWQFPTDDAKLRAEQVLRDIEAGKKPTAMVVLTRDMIDFLGCWRVDWFSALGIPSRQSA
jgi:hypothetical protein